MNRLFRYRALSFAIIILWSLVTLLALAAMYKLWWQRERVDYLGKSLAGQHLKIWQNAGLPQELLVQVEKAARDWPAEARYTAAGDQNRLSYAKYILLPRVPDGSRPYIIKENGEYSPAGLAATSPREPGSAIGFCLSVLVLAVMATALTRILPIQVDTPEAFGLISLFVMGCCVVSRVLLGSAVAGFQAVTVLGVAAFVFQIPVWQKRISGIFRTAERSALYDRNLWWKLGLTLIIALFILWSLLMSVIVVPDDWDAWAIWGAKAKVLALGHGSLKDVTWFGHGDYPLMWPSIWAFSGWLSGGWEEMWSRGWGSIFLLLTVWEVAIIIRRSTASLFLGLLGGALFVSVPMVPLVTSWSYAEAPFWLLTTTCVGCLITGQGNELARTICSALLAAAAAYTKNEGVMFAALVFCWMLCMPETRRVKKLLVFLMTFSLCYFPWFYWTHWVLHLQSHAVAGLHLDLHTLQRAAFRVRPALESIGRMWLDVKQWNIVLWLCLALSVPGIFSREGRKWLIIPYGMLLGYFLIVVFHPAEIYWQIGTSWNRLTIHALPLLLIHGMIRTKTLVQGAET